MIEERSETGVECEDCNIELEYIDEKDGIVICPKCGCIYDLNIWKFERK